MVGGYDIFLINGRSVMIAADRYEYEDGTYTFYLDDDCVGEFQKNNIAGISVIAFDEDEDF